jgi:hypothetical protein
VTIPRALTDTAGAIGSLVRGPAPRALSDLAGATDVLAPLLVPWALGGDVSATVAVVASQVSATVDGEPTGRP